MITPEEYIIEKPKKIWMHGIDCLSHVLQGDREKTAFKDDGDHPTYLENLRIELEKHSRKDDKFKEALEETYRKEFKVKSFAAEAGDFITERYLNGDKQCFDDFRKDDVKRPATSILMDMSVPGSHRGGSDMQRRHEIIYKLAAEAEAENKPCRVISAIGVMIPEIDYPKFLRVYLVIKDYNDPIFPGIWGAFKNNSSTNDFLNVFMDYLIGTRASGNGSVQNMNVSEDIFGDEIVLIEPTWISK